MQVKTLSSYYYRKIQTSFYSFLIKLLGKKIIVITGCGRSGTTFSSKWMNLAGLNIGHERLLLDGVSSWYLLSHQDNVPIGPTRNDIKDLKKITIHQVREPLAAISSIQSLGKPSWDFLSKELPINLHEDSKVLQAMKYYYFWNLRAEKNFKF